MKQASVVAAISLSAILMVSCGKKQTGNAIAVMDKVAVKATPEKNGTFITGLSQWEQVQWLGDSAVDAEKHVYYKVQLSDGKIGWAGGYGTVINGVLSVLKSKAELFKRPDMTTRTSSILPELAVVIVKQEKDQFVEVIGAGKKTHGWISKENVVSNDADVKAAVIFALELKAQGNVVSEKLIESVTQKIPDPNSFIVQKYREQLQILEASNADSVTAASVPQSIEGGDMTAQ